MTQRPRFPAARRRAVRARAEEVDRLCGDGAHQARRRGAGRFRLVGRRQLERGLGHLDHDATATPIEGPAVVHRQPQQPGALRRVGADRRGRPRRRRRGRDRRRRAGRGARQGRKASRRWSSSSRRRTGARRSSTAASTGPGATTRASTPATRYQVKRIVVKPGAQLSLQKHFHRAEHWVVVQGHRRGHGRRRGPHACTRTSRSISRSAASIAWPIPGKIPLELIEVQVGSYLGEDDIVRLDDVYGRQ